MNLLNKLTIKSLKLNKKRTIVTIIGIILSTALITAVSSMLFSFRKSLIELEKKENGNYHFVYTGFNKDEIKYFENNRAIDSYYITNEIGYAEVESKNEYKPYIYFIGCDKKYLETKKNNLEEGRLPENENEIAISSHLNSNGRVKYKIGDTIKFTIGKRYQDDNEIKGNIEYITEEEFKPEYTKEYKIVGIIERLPYVEEPYEAAGYSAITVLDEKQINNNITVFARFNKYGLNNQVKINSSLLGIKEETYKILFTEGIEINEEKLEKAIEEIENCSKSFAQNEYLVMLESSPFKSSTMKGLLAIAGVVIFIIMFTSIFCIKNSFDISITEKIKQYGMLSSIGSTKKQIKKNVYYEAFILSLFGIPLGILSGILASFILIKISNYFLRETLNTDLIFTFSIIAIIASIILAVITIYLSSLRSANKASKISPIDAIRNTKDIKISNKKYKSPKIIKKIFGIGGDVSYKNLQRNKKKYRTTVISIIVCVAMFISLSTFVEMSFRVTNLMVSTQNYNIYFSYLSDTTPYEELAQETKDKINSILELDNIDKYSVINDIGYLKPSDNFKMPYTKEYKDYIERESSSGNTTHLTIYKIGNKPFEEYVKSIGLNPENLKHKAIIINKFKTEYYDQKDKKQKKQEMDILNVKPNDKLTLSYFILNEDESDGTDFDYDITIGAITASFPIGLGIEETNPLKIIVSDDYFNEIQNATSTDSMNIKDTSIRYYIDSSNPDKLQDDIDELMGNELKYNLDNFNESIKAMKSLFTLVAIFLYGFIIVIALIGITNIFNTITTSMNLRSKEFAILKCIGMTKKEFNRMIILESFFYGTKSLLIGIPIGIILSKLLFNVLANGSFLLSYVLPYKSIIISILSVFILITIIMKYSISKINKQNIIETIRNENI